MITLFILTISMSLMALLIVFGWETIKEAFKSQSFISWVALDLSMMALIKVLYFD